MLSTGQRFCSLVSHARCFAGPVRNNRLRVRDKQVAFAKSKKHRYDQEDMRMSSELNTSSEEFRRVDQYPFKPAPKLEISQVINSGVELNLFKLNSPGATARVTEHNRKRLNDSVRKPTDRSGKVESRRKIRVQEEIHRKISEIFNKRNISSLELAVYQASGGTAGAVVEVTRVAMSDDLKLAKIYWMSPIIAEGPSVGPENLKYIAHALDKHTGILRYELTQSLQLRFSPKVEFIYDKYADDLNIVDEEIRTFNLEN